MELQDFMIALQVEVVSKRKIELDANAAKESFIASIIKQSQELSVLKSEMDKATTNQYASEKNHNNLDV